MVEQWQSFILSGRQENFSLHLGQIAVHLVFLLLVFIALQDHKTFDMISVWEKIKGNEARDFVVFAAKSAQIT